MNRFLIILSFCSLFLACDNTKNTPVAGKSTNSKADGDSLMKDTAIAFQEEGKVAKLPLLTDTSFVSLNHYEHDINLEFRYADTNNFLHEQVYDCANCVLRKEVIESLLKVNASLQKKGVRLRLFDCYRPLSVQFKMWDIFPDGRYVANPHKSGSIHNKGGAVDLTLETLDGEKLDMGTDFDHFGKEAHLSFTELPDTVLSNRALLQEAMMAGGFLPLKTEWWHFNYKNAAAYTVSNFPISCD